jgi:predicted flap endonuclease-1-like 5' DNA nuclease
VVTFRDEAIQLAQIREELGQRLAKREQAIQDLERRLGARTRELEQAQGGGLIRQPGSRATGPERELAALMVAHENDLADLEARYLGIVRERDVALEEAAQRIRELEFAMASGEAAEGQATSPERRAELEALVQQATEAQARVAKLEQLLREESETRSVLQLRVTQLEELQEHTAHTNGAGGKAAAADAPDEDEAEDGIEEAASKRRRTRRKRRREADDLKEISGVDGSVEMALHLLGVTSFRQVARWKEKDVDRIAQKLYQPAERIRNEGWVESAREAHTRKYGKAP